MNNATQSHLLRRQKQTTYILECSHIRNQLCGSFAEFQQLVNACNCQSLSYQSPEVQTRAVPTSFVKRKGPRTVRGNKEYNRYQWKKIYVPAILMPSIILAHVRINLGGPLFTRVCILPSHRRGHTSFEVAPETPPM